MNKTDWQGSNIAVLGYGVEGQSSVNYFLAQGARVDVHEQKPLTDLPQHLVQSHQKQGVNFKLEQSAFKALDQYDLIMRTPTFPPDHIALNTVEKDKISSQAQLFLTEWRDQTIGISGTKGKGTVTTLIHHLLTKAGMKSILGGNIGVPLLDIMHKMDEQTIAVVELSSFQLWDITISPKYAALLMVVPEHLEQHHTLENYLNAKQNLLRFQHAADRAIILADYNYTAQLAYGMPATQFYVTRQEDKNGVLIKGESIFLSSDVKREVARLSDTVLRGSHNTENLAVAILAASLLGVELQQAADWLKDYRPLPHRLELISRHGQIKFYDDSIATTPEAASAGIRSFTEPTVVILGGINKQAAWSNLVRDIARSSVCAIVLVGEEAPRIRQALQETGKELPLLYQPADYDEAITWAAAQLQTTQGGVVLLSPGAKSFDQYQDYRDRGDKFAAAVQRFTQSNQK